jgi:hypothetical protein
LRKVHLVVLAAVVWSWDVSSVHSVRDVIRLARSSGRVAGVDGQLEQWVGFVEVLFGNELSSFVEGLHEELLVRGYHGMARPQVADGGTASDMEGSCE